MSEAEKIFLVVSASGIAVLALGVIVGKVLRNSVESHIYEIATYGEEDEL